jgi:hypothetical protein
MKTWISRGFVALGVAMVAASAGSTKAFGQEQAASDLTVKKMYVKTYKNQNLTFIPDQESHIFSKTTVSCPNPGNCLLRMEVALQASSQAGSSLVVKPTVDNAEPLPTVGGARMLAGFQDQSGYGETRSYTWYQEVTPGNHSVEVLAWASFIGSTALVEHGTLTISVLR